MRLYGRPLNITCERCGERVTEHEVVEVFTDIQQNATGIVLTHHGEHCAGFVPRERFRDNAPGDPVFVYAFRADGIAGFSERPTARSAPPPEPPAATLTERPSRTIEVLPPAPPRLLCRPRRRIMGL